MFNVRPKTQSKNVGKIIKAWFMNIWMIFTMLLNFIASKIIRNILFTLIHLALRRTNLMSSSILDKRRILLLILNDVRIFRSQEICFWIEEAWHDFRLLILSAYEKVFPAILSLIFLFPWFSRTCYFIHLFFSLRADTEFSWFGTLVNYVNTFVFLLHLNIVFLACSHSLFFSLSAPYILSARWELIQPIVGCDYAYSKVPDLDL